MSLDRQSIEKKDFPLGRRGYDPEAVDAHLGAIADEVAELRRSVRRRSDTLASTASEQVRAIVEAAENSAAEIQRQAEEDAREIRDEANREAEATREDATRQARDYVGTVSESTSGMLSRLDSMESELGALIESVRTGANRINADLRVLEEGLTEVRGVVSPRPPFEPEHEPEAAPAAAHEPVAAEPAFAEAGASVAEHSPEPAGGAVEAGLGNGSAPEGVGAEPGGEGSFSAHAGGEGGFGAAQPTGESGFGEQPAAEGGYGGPEEAAVTAEAPAEATGGSDDAEGARLIALNMALNGTPREETDRYLSENFQLVDRGRLLDEVYASVEG